MVAENWTVIAPGFHLVRTQAGFKRAAHNFEKAAAGEPHAPVVGHPASYPAVVTFFWTNGYPESIGCRCVHVNVLREAIKDA